MLVTAAFPPHATIALTHAQVDHMITANRTPFRVSAPVAAFEVQGIPLLPPHRGLPSHDISPTTLLRASSS